MNLETWRWHSDCALASDGAARVDYRAIELLNLDIELKRENEPKSAGGKRHRKQQNAMQSEFENNKGNASTFARQRQSRYNKS
jgi:hypothetical protein